MKLKLVGLALLIFILSCHRQTEEEKLIKDALTIHEEIFTVDSHTDTPLWFVRGDFNLAEKHDARDSTLFIR
ncbi:MAG: hypothetical protein B6D64_08335 [Bacteroidetes bacterium 4484_276]|nr:MAG: hypothetical protein B6D64_08335 [Bacteroidetes bacterium 4484_276]